MLKLKKKPQSKQGDWIKKRSAFGFSIKQTAVKVTSTEYLPEA